MKYPHLRESVNAIPFSPGVYFMKSKSNQTLYIGKARSLKKRVRSYLAENPQIPKIKVLMDQVTSIEYVETHTEVDALLLEAQLIRKYKPRYNKELKDDKSYPLIKITGDAFPRLHITRQKKDKKATYYGPFTDAKLLREAVNLVNTLFPIRKCQRLPKTACLYYHINQCIAPCIKPEIKKEYDRLISEVKTFLGGGKKSFLEYLNDRMQQASRELRFEDAGFYKEQIMALSKLKKKKFSIKKQDGGIMLSASMQLKKSLNLKKMPEKIVCFDVSNIQGDQAVASKVSFYRELPDKIEYRRYKIKKVSGINDYAMIQEALGRMIRGLKTGKESFIPDVIMIDGGKGHLAAAKEILKKEDYDEVKLISIAKRFEIIYDGDSSSEAPIERDSSALYLLQKIRDEAHRFAITYHRGLKLKMLSKSALDGIPKIGDKRKKILLNHFASVEEIKRSSIEKIAGLPGMNHKVAEQVWNYFKPESQ